MLVTENCSTVEPMQKVVRTLVHLFNSTAILHRRAGFYCGTGRRSSAAQSNLNVSAGYNTADHPGASSPRGIRGSRLVWDNLSEVTPDPVRGTFDFRSYRIGRRRAGSGRRLAAPARVTGDGARAAAVRSADSNFRHDAAADTLSARA